MCVCVCVVHTVTIFAQAFVFAAGEIKMKLTKTSMQVIKASLLRHLLSSSGHTRMHNTCFLYGVCASPHWRA